MKVSAKTQAPDTHTLFEQLFISSPDAIVVVDSEGIIVEANPQTESLFEYASSDLLGKPVEILIPQRFKSLHPAHRMDFNNRPRMRPMGTGLELFGSRKDGSEFPIDIVLSPVETAEGNFVLCVIRDITDRKQLEEEMRQLALSDPLTGLGNYRRLQDAFETEMKWAQRTGRSCAVLLIDLDGLKAINDVHGHLAGSRALCRLAEVLRVECRAVDTAARHGGDEFAIVLPDTHAKGARNLARRLANRIANDGETPPVSFSYGVGVYPDDGKTLHQLLEVADHSLYDMKKSKH